MSLQMLLSDRKNIGLDKLGGGSCLGWNRTEMRSPSFLSPSLTIVYWVHGRGQMGWAVRISPVTSGTGPHGVREWAVFR